MIPPEAQALLGRIPEHFVDDGCSLSPDFGFRWACRIHDWWWCTRAHPEGTMTEGWKVYGDVVLAEYVRQHSPFLGPIYWAAVRIFRSGYNTCMDQPPRGASKEQLARGECRHGLRVPADRWGREPTYLIHHEDGSVQHVRGRKNVG